MTVLCGGEWLTLSPGWRTTETKNSLFPLNRRLLIIVIIILFCRHLFAGDLQLCKPIWNKPQFYGIYVAAVLCLQFVVHVMLLHMINVSYFYICTFRNMCTVPSTTVFCSFLNSCFPVVLFMYFMNDFEVAQVARVIRGIFFCVQLIIIIYNGDTGNCRYSLSRCWCLTRWD